MSSVASNGQRAGTSGFTRLPIGAQAYVLLVIASGAGAAMWSVRRSAFEHPVLLCGFVLASLFASGIKINLPVRWSYSTLSIASAISFASLLSLGAGATTWVAMVGGWSQCTVNAKTRNPWYRTLFSMSCLSLSMELAGQALTWTGGAGARGPLTTVIPSLVVSALVYFLANSLLVAGVVSLSTSRSLLQIWDQDFLWAAPNYFIGAFAAFVTVAAVREFGYAAAALIGLPLFLTYRLYQVYLGRVEDERRHVRELSEMHLATVEALALAIDAKDSTAKSHVHRVQRYAMALAADAQVSDALMEGIRTAALLHDIGKLGVPDYVLSKPGPLTDDEFDKVRLHPELGAEIVAKVRFPYPVAPLIRSHHERWDGTGYPAGLAANDIPLGARIIAVADRFDALRTERVYRPALSLEESIAHLEEEAGTGLDPALVKRFVQLLPDIEPGVQLTRGAAATVSRDVSTLGQPGSGAIPEGKRDVYEDIARAQRELYALYEVAQSMGTGLGVADTMTLIVEKLGRLVPFSGCALYIAEETGLECRFASGVDADRLKQISMRRADGLIGWVLRNRRHIINGDPATDLTAASLDAHGLALQSALVCPLVFDHMTAALAVYHVEPRFYAEHDSRLLERVAKQAAAVIGNAMLFERAQTESLTDPLTGVPNRRFLISHLASELERVNGTDEQLGILMLDLNNFKGINDTFGHAVGDEALKHVADRLKTQLGDDEICCRYAGDEFVVVLSSTTPDNAKAKAHALLHAVEEVTFEAAPGHRIHLAFSLGIAVAPHDGRNCDTLLATADARMYAHKVRLKDKPTIAMPSGTLMPAPVEDFAVHMAE